MYHVKPAKGHTKNSNIGGAYVNCYIEAKEIEEADKIARPRIEELHWKIKKEEDSYLINRSDFDETWEGLPYYEQALIDKAVFVFHTYPAK